jgi:ketopantoate reductase
MSSRNSDTENVKNVFQRFIDENQINQKFDEARISEIWQKVMGNAIHNRTTKIFLSNYKLFIYVNSAPLRNNLHYEKDRIVKMLNEQMGKDVIKEVVVR